MKTRKYVTPQMYRGYGGGYKIPARKHHFMGHGPIMNAFKMPKAKMGTWKGMITNLWMKNGTCTNIKEASGLNLVSLTLSTYSRIQNEERNMV